MFHWHGSLVYASINIKHEVPVCYSESAIKYAIEEGVMVCSWQRTSPLCMPHGRRLISCAPSSIAPLNAVTIAHRSLALATRF